MDVGRCLAIKSFEDDQQCFEFNPVFDWKPVKRNERRGYVIIFPQIENTPRVLFPQCVAINTTLIQANVLAEHALSHNENTG